jgi:ribonuclease P protein component
MPKRQRMTRADFSSMSVGKSRRFFGTYFSLSVTPFQAIMQANEPKYACVVSKKAAARAVDRNAIKRRCREAVRLAAKGPALSASFVFYAKKEARGVSYAEIAKDIRKLIAQAK